MGLLELLVVLAPSWHTVAQHRLAVLAFPCPIGNVNRLHSLFKQLLQQALVLLKAAGWRHDVRLLELLVVLAASSRYPVPQHRLAVLTPALADLLTARLVLRLQGEGGRRRQQWHGMPIQAIQARVVPSTAIN